MSNFCNISLNPFEAMQRGQLSLLEEDPVLEQEAQRIAKLLTSRIAQLQSAFLLKPDNQWLSPKNGLSLNEGIGCILMRSSTLFFLSLRINDE